ncbi:MAG: hypothetical protein QG577_1413 [Thermodesulfobacteriota bacterium]|nr:hypothetical protein [Thermodesulfobacteriota bacterium]
MSDSVVAPVYAALVTNMADEVSPTTLPSDTTPLMDRARARFRADLNSVRAFWNR